MAVGDGELLRQFRNCPFPARERANHSQEPYGLTVFFPWSAARSYFHFFLGRIRCDLFCHKTMVDVLPNRIRTQGGLMMSKQKTLCRKPFREDKDDFQGDAEMVIAAEEFQLVDKEGRM